MANLFMKPTCDIHNITCVGRSKNMTVTSILTLIAICCCCNANSVNAFQTGNQINAGYASKALRHQTSRHCKVNLVKPASSTRIHVGARVPTQLFGKDDANKPNDKDPADDSDEKDTPDEPNEKDAGDEPVVEKDALDEPVEKDVPEEPSEDSATKKDTKKHVSKKDISKKDISKKDESNVGMLGNFIYGVKATFAGGIFVKIQLLSTVVYFATVAISSVATNFLPTPVNRVITGFLHLTYEFGAVLMERFIYLTSLVPQLVLAGVVVSIAWTIIYFLMSLEGPRDFLMPKFVTLKEMTNRGETPMGITVLREAVHVVQVCLVSAFLEEVTYRLFLPSAINNLFYSKKDFEDNGEDQQDAITKIRPRDNPRIVKICSVLFALAHLEAAVSLASTRGHLASQVNRKFVLTYFLSQRILAPVFRERGLMASWGAHASFNAAAVALFSTLDYLSKPFGKMMGVSV